MNTTKIDNVESITANLFSDILRDHWIKQNSDTDNDNDSEISNYNDNNVAVVVPKINSISLKKVEHGVLSDVYRVHLDYDEPEYTNSKNNQADAGDDATITKIIIPSTGWLVKICRPDLDLSWMCQNEIIFYDHVLSSITTTTSSSSSPSSIADTTNSLPFTFPKFLCGSDQYLILQEELDVITYPLMDGCPSDKIDFLLRCMAGMHATFWGKSNFFDSSNNNNVSLVATAGMGQRLPPLQKEGLFISSWQETIDYLRLQNELEDTDVIDFITNLSQKLSTLKLRNIHDSKYTAVYSD